MKLERKESKIILSIERELASEDAPNFQPKKLDWLEVQKILLDAAKARLTHCEQEIMDIMLQDDCVYSNEHIWSNKISKISSLPAHKVLKSLVSELEDFPAYAEDNSLEMYCQNSSIFEINQLLKAVAVFTPDWIMYKKEIIDILIDSLIAKHG